MIRYIDDILELNCLTRDWGSIESMVPDVRIFQTFEWCRAAWTLYLNRPGNSLYILVWQQENVDDMVIFPFYLDQYGTLRFIMDEHSDCCDCVYVPGRNHHLAYKEALEYIKGDNKIKQISLHKMDGNSEALNYFAALAPQGIVSKENTYSWINVMQSEDFASSQSQLRSKDKANVRAIKRKAEKYVLRLFSHVNGNDDKYPEHDIDSLVENMKQRGWREKDFMTGGLRDFCRKIYEIGIGYIVELIDDSTPVALNFILTLGNRHLSWIFLYSNPHASTELYVKYFYNKVAVEPYVFDFGTGGYEYKLGTFRPCTRALFGLDIVLDDKLARRLVIRRFVRAGKNLVKTIFPVLKRK